MNHYLLYISSGTSKFYLATRQNIGIEESDDFQTFTNNQAAACVVGCSLDQEFTSTFKIHFIGGCDLSIAWTLFNSLKTFINANCNSELILHRRVQDEPEQLYKMSKLSLRIIETRNQYLPEHILTIELSATFITWPSGGYVSLGGHPVASFSPLVVSVTPKSSSQWQVAALQVYVNIPTPGVSLS